MNVQFRPGILSIIFTKSGGRKKKKKKKTRQKGFVTMWST